ncbi:hypothetical protein ACFSQ7_08990 [Paenibacillus rhizoplanae]
MTQELVSVQHRLTPVLMGHALAVVIGSEDEGTESFHRMLYALTEKLQQEINEVLKLQVSIGLSLPFHSFDKMSIAYRESLEALKHRITLGKGIIIQYENLNSGKHYLNLNYPTHTEK